MNTYLKAKIIQQHGQQWRFAKMVGIHESVISKFITGCRQPSLDDQGKIAKALNCEIREIFPEKEPCAN